MRSVPSGGSKAALPRKLSIEPEPRSTQPFMLCQATFSLAPTQVNSVGYIPRRIGGSEDNSIFGCLRTSELLSKMSILFSEVTILIYNTVPGFPFSWPYQHLSSFNFDDNYSNRYGMLCHCSCFVFVWF